MQSCEMGVLNDDGVALDLSIVLLLFLMPNFIFILLTSFNAYLVYVSKKHPRLNNSLGKAANFFAKGALDRIVRNMLRHFEKKRQQKEQISMTPERRLGIQRSSFAAKNAPTSTDTLSFEKKYDANYLLLVPFQVDLLLTVCVYKILTREVYPETCQTFLTTYANRESQVVCWLKHTNKNISNLSANISLLQYCTNQSITYINYEHNDVICIQYIFKLINIIDTVTNIFAWHQAIVFIVTKSIVFSYWYQQKLRKTICWLNLVANQRCCILSCVICSLLLIYILVFVFLLPIQFILLERKRIDLTRHLLYACAKFIVAIILHVNLYTLHQWHSHMHQKSHLLAEKKEKEVECRKVAESIVSIENTEYASPSSTLVADDYLGTASTQYLTPDVSV